MSDKPWVGGPKELLMHGLEHLQEPSDFDARIAIISIDNAVELMIKVYLGLPKRITGIQLSLTKYEEISRSFTTLVDTLEQLAPERTNGIELGDIEWFHRLRNALYHEGNGITVEREKVEIYAAIAKVLLTNLFGASLDETPPTKPNVTTEEHITLEDFILAWRDLEDELVQVAKARGLGPTAQGKYLPVFMLVEVLAQHGLLSEVFVEEFGLIHKFRNELVHGKAKYNSDEIKQYYIMTEKLFDIAEKL